MRPGTRSGEIVLSEAREATVAIATLLSEMPDPGTAIEPGSPADKQAEARGSLANRLAEAIPMGRTFGPIEFTLSPQDISLLRACGAAELQRLPDSEAVVRDFFAQHGAVTAEEQQALLPSLTFMNPNIPPAVARANSVVRLAPQLSGLLAEMDQLLPPEGYEPRLPIA